MGLISQTSDEKGNITTYLNCVVDNSTVNLQIPYKIPVRIRRKFIKEFKKIQRFDKYRMELDKLIGR